MEELCQLHSKTGVESTGEYLTQEEDRQVGLGMLGLANLLALEGVTYAQFADALENVPLLTPQAITVVKAIQDGLNCASQIARDYKMDRAFAIALPHHVATVTQTEQAIQLPPNWHHPSGVLLIGTALHSA